MKLFFRLFRQGGTNENHQPFRAKLILYFKQRSNFCLYHRLAEQRSFCPSTSPDGQKKKILCDRACRAVAFAEAGDSVVKYRIRNT